MCRILGVVRSGYYRWRKVPVGKRKMADMILSMHIKDIFEQSRDTYGSYRIHAELLDEGIRCGRERVARLARENNLEPKAARRFKIMTTDSKHRLPVAPNVFNQNFTAQEPDQIWLTNITYVPTAEGWLYLAAVMDLYSRRIVDWAISDSLHRQLVIDALQMAIATRQPSPGLLHHSDRGSQYASQDYQALLTQYQMVGSMSRKGNCYDNAPMESFFGTFKTELTFHCDYATRNEARLDIFEYIEVFYNRKQRHSALGYKSPAKYETLSLVA
jgi:transposase InsO family protein